MNVFAATLKTLPSGKKSNTTSIRARFHNTATFLKYLSEFRQDEMYLRQFGIGISNSGLLLFGTVISSLLSSAGVPRKSTMSPALRHASLCFMAAVRLGDDILDAVGEHLTAADVQALIDQADLTGEFVCLSSASFIRKGVVEATMHTLPTRHLTLLGNRIDRLDSLVAKLNDEVQAHFGTTDGASILVCFKRAYNLSFYSYLLERRSGPIPDTREYECVAKAKSAKIIHALVELGDFLGFRTAEEQERTKAFFGMFALMLTMFDDLFDLALDMDRQPNFLWVVASDSFPNEHLALRNLCGEENVYMPLWRLVKAIRCAPNTFLTWWQDYRVLRRAAKTNSPFLFLILEAPFVIKYCKRLFLPY